MVKCTLFYCLINRSNSFFISQLALMHNPLDAKHLVRNKFYEYSNNRILNNNIFFFFCEFLLNLR